MRTVQQVYHIGYPTNLRLHLHTPLHVHCIQRPYSLNKEGAGGGGTSHLTISMTRQGAVLINPGKVASSSPPQVVLVCAVTESKSVYFTTTTTTRPGWNQFFQLSLYERVCVCVSFYFISIGTLYAMLRLVEWSS